MNEEFVIHMNLSYKARCTLRVGMYEYKARGTYDAFENVCVPDGLNAEINVSKEAYYETYSYGKRDLLIRQKRPTHMAKETYS